jgi:hypothetical protein
MVAKEHYRPFSKDFIVLLHFKYVCKIEKATISFVMSVSLSARPSAWNKSAHHGCIFMKFNV